MSSDKSSIISQQNLTAPNYNNNCIYEYEDIRLDAAHLMLYRNKQTISLKPKVVETLVALVEKRGEVISKDELMNRLWADSFVEESNLTQNIYLLRKTLGNRADGKAFIENFSRRGYRFNGEIKSPVETQLFVATHTKTHTVIEERIEHELAPTAVGEAVEILAERVADRSAHLEQRDQTTTGFWKRRSRLFAGGVILLAATGGIVYLTSFRTAVQPKTGNEPAEQTLAVLPFKLLNPTDTSDYLSVGLADSLITKLSNVHSLTVRPTSAVMHYPPNETEAAGAGLQLKVDSVIDGAVQQSGDRVRVTVQLIRVSDGKPLWANTYDAQFVNIFQVEDEISTSITAALKIQLSGEEKARLSHRPTDNIQAYQLYLLGNYHLYKFGPGGMDKAFQSFNEAIALDPTFALAYTGLANAYGISALSGNDPAIALAEAASLKAVELDPNLSEAHTALAAGSFWQKHDIEKAQESFDRALQLDPNSALAHHYYTWFLTATGRFDEAEQHIRRALELDPISEGINIDQGRPLFYAHRFAEARSRQEQALKLYPNSWLAHLGLGEACEATGDFVCAIAEFGRADAPSRIASVPKLELARTLALAGKTGDARKLLGKLNATKSPQISYYYVALVYSALDDKDNAFANLNNALTYKDHWLYWAKVDPRFDTLRGDGRFDDFLIRANMK